MGIHVHTYLIVGNVDRFHKVLTYAYSVMFQKAYIHIFCMNILIMAFLHTCSVWTDMYVHTYVLCLWWGMLADIIKWYQWPEHNSPTFPINLQCVPVCEYVHGLLHSCEGVFA